MRRRGIRTAGGILVSIMMLIGLAACGKKESTIQLVEEDAGKEEYLNFFSSVSLADSDIGKYWTERFTREYNKNVYINYDGATYYSDQGDSYRELLEKRLNGSNPDDLYIINAEDVLGFDEKGYWMDLSDMDFVDNLSEMALYQSTYNGKVFSVPLTFTGFGFYWNVDLLEEHGLTVPGNLEEFWFVCEKLKSEGILPYIGSKGYSLTVPVMCRGMAELYAAEDSEERIAELNGGEVPVSSYLQEGFELLLKMIENGYLDPAQSLEIAPDEAINKFKEGKNAFVCAGLGAITQEETSGFRIELTGLPVLEDGCIAVYGADNRLCVNPKSKNLDTALQFIEMVGTPEALRESAEMEHTMTTAKDGGVTVASTDTKLSELLKQPGQIPNQDFALHFNTWENIRNVCREICAGMSVDDACKLIDELQREELECY